MADFSVEVELGDNGVAVLSLTGSLDSITFPELAESLHRLFDDSTYNIVVNLSGLHYISSAGIGALIEALSVAKDHHGGMVLMKVRGEVKEALEFAGATELFKTASGVHQALRLLKE